MSLRSSPARDLEVSSWFKSFSICFNNPDSNSFECIHSITLSASSAVHFFSRNFFINSLSTIVCLCLFPIETIERFATSTLSKIFLLRGCFFKEMMRKPRLSTSHAQSQHYLAALHDRLNIKNAEILLQRKTFIDISLIIAETVCRLIHRKSCLLVN